MASLSDEELNAYILTRLRNIGVDLSVLPEDDRSAPADQQRVLASARRLLRNTVPAISDLELDPQNHPPGMYPTMMPAPAPSPDVQP